MDWFALSVTGPNVVAVRVVTQSPIGLILGLGTESGNAVTAKHVVEAADGNYREAIVFVPDGDTTLFVCVTRGDTDTSEVYVGFEDTINYDLVYRIGHGSGTAPGLEVETAIEGEENELVTFAGDGSANSGGVIRYRCITTDWRANGATLDAETGDYRWTPGYSDAGDHLFVLVATEYPSGFPADDVGLSVIAIINMDIANVNRLPVVSDREDITVDAGVCLRTDFAVIDEDGDEITVTVELDGSPLPETARWNRGSFTWTPDSGDIGPHSLEITAVEDGNPSAVTMVQVSIEVTEPDTENAPPVVRKPKWYEEGDVASPNWTFEVVFEDTDIDDAAGWWQVQIATQSTFESVVWDSETIPAGDNPPVFGDTIRCVYANALAWDTVHYWRIRACDSNEAISEWAVGTSFTTPPEPPAAEETMPDAVITAATGTPVALPLEDEGVGIASGYSYTALFDLASGDTLQLRLEFSGDEAVFYEIWHVVDAEHGIQRYLNVRSVPLDEEEEPASNTVRRARYLVREDGLYVLYIHQYDRESTGSVDINVIASVTPRPPQSDNEKRLGELDDQTPAGVDPSPPPSIDDPAFGSVPDWREPEDPPPESNPPASDCVWRVNIEFWDEVLDDVKEPVRIYYRDVLGWEPVRDAYSQQGKVYRVQDEKNIRRHALGGFAYSSASVLAHRANGSYAYKAGATLPENVTSTARRVEGFWMLTATWLGDCGQPVVNVHAYSAMAAELSVTAKWDEGLTSGEAEYADIKQFDLQSASSRTILCPDVNVDVRTQIAFGVKKDADKGVVQIPSITGDLIGDAITVANIVLQHLQGEWNDSDDRLYLSADPSTDGSAGWADDEGSASIASVNLKIRSKSGSSVTLARPDHAAGGSGSAPYDERNSAWINSRTSEMIAAISLVCESGNNENCVGDIIRILYHIGPIPSEGKDADNHTQDVHIATNPNDPSQKARVIGTPKALGQDTPEGDGPRKSSTIVDVAGENHE